MFTLTNRSICYSCAGSCKKLREKGLSLNKRSGKSSLKKVLHRGGWGTEGAPGKGKAPAQWVQRVQRERSTEPSQRGQQKSDQAQPCRPWQWIWL